MNAPDWDVESLQLQENLKKVLERLVEDADRRVMPRVDMAKQWHSMAMEGLDADGDPTLIGNFRGEPGLERLGVRIGGIEGVLPGNVAAALKQFESTLQSVVARLDKRYPAGADLDLDGIRAAIDLAAWAHSEWVRIHPFANGNGRTARAWANFLLARYGVPPVISLRPRPDGSYGAAGAMAMRGHWRSTAAVFASIIKEATAAPTARTPGRTARKTPRPTQPAKIR
jgi:prophage maintenance system killer protein